MNKYNKNDEELVTLLLKIQEETAPIKLSIGYVRSGSTVHQGIILNEAPPKVIETLIEHGYICDLRDYGMRVYKL